MAHLLMCEEVAIYLLDFCVEEVGECRLGPSA